MIVEKTEAQKMRVTCPGSVVQLGLEIAIRDSLYHVALLPDPHIPSRLAGTNDNPLEVEDCAPNL